MALLHGSWLVQPQGNNLFIWGETWRRMTATETREKPDAVVLHPLAMTPTELTTFLISLQQSGKLNGSLPEFLFSEVKSPAKGRKSKRTEPSNLLSEVENRPGSRWQLQTLAIPSRIFEPASHWFPQHSATQETDEIQTESLYLFPWHVQGFYLNPAEAFTFLQTLPLSPVEDAEGFVGPDLLFWAQTTRWSLDLLVRSKCLPSLVQTPEGTVLAKWQPLLDSATDQMRLANFSKQMPAACRSYQTVAENQPLALNFPPTPQALLKDFLSDILDAQMRLAFRQNPEIKISSPWQEWLRALASDSAHFVTETKAKEQLEKALSAWTTPLQTQIEQTQFRTSFHLIPPLENHREWRLNYGLQAIDQPEFVIEARVIWDNPVERLSYRGRVIHFPQETLLSGLGLASKLYPWIEPSLQEQRPQYCQLTASHAYEFLKSVAWRFTDSGLGVILPPSLANRDGWASRLGLSIQAEVPRKKSERLGLQSLLNFKWELTIGGQQISKAEFDRLVALNSPLVEINGEWVEFRPADVKAAQTFFASRQEQMTLSLEDALRLAAGDTQTIEKLPVVNFEASGQLQELLNTLTNNQSLETIVTPKSFHGELRPYQARGVGWLAFLEKWGLGACLADDMGLGKCVLNDTRIFVNGLILEAEEIWKNYAGKVEFDGEGFWSIPQEQLLVNSLDENTGKIVQAPIQRLYRQPVQEKLQKITLNDGNSITITRRHKLLTDNGWTNHLHVGDYVGVPAKLVWKGQSVDADLVKFLAWQIAKGEEQHERSTLTITPKNVKVLEELRLTLSRLSERYGININTSAIQITTDHQVASLTVCSRAYQNFLESQGYSWGKHSSEKSFPPLIMQADLDSVRLFLRNYFDAEASVSFTMQNVEISTTSSLLIQQLSTLLRRFGIWLRIDTKEKHAAQDSGILRTDYIGKLGGNSARIFLQEIGFNFLEKQQKLEKICGQIYSPNVEEFPTSDLVAHAVQTTKIPSHSFGMHNSVDINNSQQFSQTCLVELGAAMDHLFTNASEQDYHPLKSSQWTKQTLEGDESFEVQQLNLISRNGQIMLNQDAFYCQIKEIAEIDYKGWVYDFEVSQYHNFVANNFLCHNTIQLIAFLLHLQEQELLEAPTLLVCPTSVLGNWEREVKKFGPGLKVFVHHGNKRAKGKAFATAIKNKQLVITSYPLAQRDLKDLQSVKWQGIVLDEAQNIKNSETKQAQAVRNLEASFKIALTGTPVENRLQELWSILDYLNPGYLGTRNFFQRRFAIPIEKYGDKESLQTLRSLVRPFILRRLKTDREIIQDLPDKQEMTIFCPLSAEQASLYQHTVESSLAEIEAAEGIQRRGQILALLVKLKQICNHPAQYLKENTLESHQRSGKLQRLEEMLEELLAAGDRALIFTQFAEWGHLLKPYLEQQFRRELLFLYGGTRQPQREEMIDRFQHDPQGPPILILSLKAGGTGLNLTRANHVFHFDRWWNPAVENQATDRAFRIGQTRNVQVHKFVCTGTLEEKIHEMIESKKALAEQVVSAGENWLTELNTDQLRNLLVLDRSSVIDEAEA